MPTFKRELYRTDYIDFSKHVSKIESLNVVGLINQRTHVTSTKTGSTLTRIPLLLPGCYQAILDIWNREERRHPEFAEEWDKNLQLIAVRDVFFVDQFLIGDKPIYHLKAASRRRDEAVRFIYLSPDEEDFWRHPVAVPDQDYDQNLDVATTWPAQPDGPNGYLRTSPGSVNVTRLSSMPSDNPLKNGSMLHVDELEPFIWADFSSLRVKLTKAQQMPTTKIAKKVIFRYIQEKI